MLMAASFAVTFALASAAFFARFAFGALTLVATATAMLPATGTDATFLRFFGPVFLAALGIVIYECVLAESRESLLFCFVIRIHNSSTCAYGTSVVANSQHVCACLLVGVAASN